MSRGIFDKWRAASRGKRDERGPRAVADAPASSGLAPGLDVVSTPIDDSLLLISRELSGLSSLPVSAAAKERGWASLQRELERHPVNASAAGVRNGNGLRVPAARAAGASSGARTARPRNLRWALGSAVGVVAIAAAVLGSYGGGLLQTADSGDNPGTVTSVVSSDTTVPDTNPSVSTPTTVPVTDGGSAVTDGTLPSDTTGPGITDGPATTGGTEPSAPTTTQPQSPVTTSGSGSGSTGTGSTTTQPPRTTTTGQQQMAAAQREGSAKALAVYLAELVITGNTSGARALVAPEAQSSLAYMATTLTEPFGHKVTGSQMLNSETVRVTLDINDRFVNNAGEWVETVKHFVIRVHVDGDAAIVVGINAGS